MALTKIQRRARIKMRVRKVVSGTAQKPRLSVFRSNKHIYAQIIDDNKGATLAQASTFDKEVAAMLTAEMNKKAQSAVVGKVIAQRALSAGVSEAAFDRNGYLYHGRVQSLAEAAREGGLKF
ncbi:MAG: 50S ribosomal protein L18 [Rikenellaceae bacterium]